MASISLLIRINAPIRQVYKALTTNESITQWFTETRCERWDIGAPVSWFKSTDMTVAELDKDKVVAFHVHSGSGWENTTVRFAIEPEEEGNNDRTLVRFDHEGWAEVTDHFRDCAMSWAYFLESLRLYVETGRGTPEPTAAPCESGG